MQQPAGAAADSTLNLHALEETVATTSQPAQATRCKGLREEQAERGYFAALERIERRPKYKKNSGEPDEFDEEQADVVAVANVILAIVPVGFGPAVYDFLRARTTRTASTLNLHAAEKTQLSLRTYKLTSIRDILPYL